MEKGIRSPCGKGVFVCVYVGGGCQQHPLPTLDMLGNASGTTMLLSIFCWTRPEMTKARPQRSMPAPMRCAKQKTWDECVCRRVSEAGETIANLERRHGQAELV